jgi:hypothetical protein
MAFCGFGGIGEWLEEIANFSQLNRISIGN